MSSPKPKLSSSSTAGSSPLVRKSSAEASSSTPASRTSSGASAGSAASPASAVKAGLKKLSVGSDAPDGTITPVRSSTGAPSPSNRTRLSPAVGTPAKSSAAPTTLSSPTAPRRATTTSTTSSSAASTSSAASSAAAAAHARTIMKAPVQSPTAAGMKMRPASGAGLNNLSSIGVSAMAAAAANPYSSSLSALSTQSPSPTQSSPSPQSASSAASASPNSPIASASPAARRYKTPTSSPTQQAAASSPIHSISQSGASATKKYDNVYTGNQAAATAAAASSAHLHGANSYRANHVHPPVNTHTQVPQGHVADHNAPPNGATIFSPVYHRTASQEQLHQAEELKKKAGGRTEAQQREDAEALYRQQQQAAAAQYAQQQAAAAAAAQAAAQAQALAHQQAQNKHTVSYTPPAVEEDEFDPFLFIKNLPPLSPAMRNRRSPLPKKLLSAPKITLALDLDETLVHCSVQPIERAELTFKVAFNGLDYEVYVRTRPHMKEFLETVSQWFEVVIFTASQKVYADKLLDILDPSKTLIKYRIFRDSCVCVDGNYLKDLHILGRELPTVAIVDNSVQAFGFQLDNGIPIESWFDDDNDRELLNLIPFLRTLKDVKDVRPLIRDTFRLTEFVASL